MNQEIVYLHHELGTCISLSTYMSSEKEGTYHIDVDCEGQYDTLFITDSIKESVIKHYEYLELLERFMFNFSNLSPSEIVDIFKFMIQINKVTNILIQ